jgi:hypothetical protein
MREHRYGGRCYGLDGRLLPRVEPGDRCASRDDGLPVAWREDDRGGSFGKSPGVL